MGMFDYVNFSWFCPKCGGVVDDFQTKSRECTLASFDVWEILGGSIHTSCKQCGEWLEYAVEPVGIPDFKLVRK